MREVTKHPEVEEIHQCEIDEVTEGKRRGRERRDCVSHSGVPLVSLFQRVVELSKKFLPTLSSGYSSPKLTLHIEDGVTFMERHCQEFDVIITDSSDPIGEIDLSEWLAVQHT